MRIVVNHQRCVIVCKTRRGAATIVEVFRDVDEARKFCEKQEHKFEMQGATLVWTNRPEEGAMFCTEQNAAFDPNMVVGLLRRRERRALHRQLTSYFDRK